MDLPKWTQLLVKLIHPKPNELSVTNKTKSQNMSGTTPPFSKSDSYTPKEAWGPEPSSSKSVMLIPWPRKGLSHHDPTVVHSPWIIPFTTSHQPLSTTKGGLVHQSKAQFSHVHYLSGCPGWTTIFGWFTCRGEHTLPQSLKLTTHLPQL